MLAATLQCWLDACLLVQIPQGRSNRSVQIRWSNQVLTSIDSPAPWMWEENCIWIIWATQLENNIYACRSVCIWKRSLCAVLGAPSYSMDMWTGGWHSLFLALVGQLICLLALLGRFFNKQPTVFRKGKDSGSRKLYWSKRVQSWLPRWARKVLIQEQSAWHWHCLSDQCILQKDSVFCDIRVWWQIKLTYNAWNHFSFQN